jgi:hypothetical protein
MSISAAFAVCGQFWRRWEAFLLAFPDSQNMGIIFCTRFVSPAAHFSLHRHRRRRNLPLATVPVVFYEPFPEAFDFHLPAVLPTAGCFASVVPTSGTPSAKRMYICIDMEEVFSYPASTRARG